VASWLHGLRLKLSVLVDSGLTPVKRPVRDKEGRVDLAGEGHAEQPGTAFENRCGIDVGRRLWIDLTVLC
jgi:hypothetical protein